MSETLEQTLKEFTEAIKRIYGENLLSLILYGSAASDEYVESKSNINVLILLKEVTPDELRKCSGQLPQWHKQRISTPLFIDPPYVRSSVDVFPIEFLDMKQRYRLLFGQDFLQPLELKRDRLLLQCEQELKGKMLRLRQLYLEASQTNNKLVSLLTKTTTSFMVLFRALLHLQRFPIPNSAEKIFASLSQLGLSTQGIAKVYDLRRTDKTPSQAEIDSLFREYLTEIQATVEFVDKMSIEQT